MQVQHAKKYVGGGNGEIKKVSARSTIALIILCRFPLLHSISFYL